MPNKYRDILFENMIVENVKNNDIPIDKIKEVVQERTSLCSSESEIEHCFTSAKPTGAVITP